MSDPNTPERSTFRLAGPPREGATVHANLKPPPCQPITNISVIEIDFLSDHNVLKNDVSNWRNEGVLYGKPDWVSATNHPVSHDMDSVVQLKVIAKVEPTNACPESGTWEGSGPGTLVFPPASVTFQPGNNTFTLTSSNKLDASVQKLSFAVTWTAKCASGPFTSSSRSYCLVTMHKPIDQGVQEDGATTKRMVQAIDLVGPMSSTDPHTIVAALMAKIPFYTLRRDPAVPVTYNHPKYFNSEGGAWPISDYLSSYAECQAIVRWVKGIIRQIGCPGTSEGVVVWASPDDGGATVREDPLGANGTITLHNMSKTISGRNCSVALAAQDPVAVGREFTQGSMMNMYEACLKFTDGGTTKYYGGGLGGTGLDTKEEVIKAFYALVWYSASAQPDGSIKNRIEEIVRRFK